jgi:two-component system CheB/CheR fusion protein
LPFPVVAVGASAGGLEALTELLGGIPSKPGVALLFALHLQPHRKSQLSQILATVTSLTVLEAVIGQVIEKAHIYLIPPDMHMALEGSKIALVPGRRAGRTYQPITCFVYWHPRRNRMRLASFFGSWNGRVARLSSHQG